MAVNRRHRGAGQFRQLLEHGLAAADRVVDGALAIELLEFLQVSTGDKAGRLGRADHHALGRINGDAFNQVAQLDQNILRQCIDRSALPIKVEHDHAVLARLRLPMTQSEPIEASCHDKNHPFAYGKATIIPRLFNPRQIPTH